MLISEDYRKLNQNLHEAVPEWGACDQTTWFGEYLKGFSSILDYGCGKGKLRVAVDDFRRYDPAVLEFAADPAPADLVICNHALEHVETDCVDAVLDHIQSLARKAVVFKISTFETRFVLDDGTSPHRSLHDADWWMPKLLERWKIVYAERVAKGLRFVGAANGKL